MDLTISQTISKLLILGHGKRADKVKSDFKVPDKRWADKAFDWQIFLGRSNDFHR